MNIDFIPLLWQKYVLDQSLTKEDFFAEPDAQVSSTGREYQVAEITGQWNGVTWQRKLWNEREITEKDCF